VTIPSSSSGGTVTFPADMFGGGSAISVSDQGHTSQDGLSGEELNSTTTVTVNGTPYNLNVTDFGGANGLSYSSFGQWSFNDTTSNKTPAAVGWYAFGTPVTGTMPTSGTASYSGKADGAVALPGSSAAYTFSGTATLNANFGANSITGGITGNNVYNINSSGSGGTSIGTTNDINFSAGTISGTGFTGTAAASSTAGTSSVNMSGATGTFRGNFYGPVSGGGPAEAGGTFNLSSGSTVMVTGAFGAKK
jgi:hypothetical protein